MVSKKEKNNYDLKEIENYWWMKTFPKWLAGKWEEVNFWGTPRRFFIKDGQLYYKDSRVADKDRQVDIVHDIHERSGNTSHSETFSVHLGRTPTYEKIATWLF